MTIYTPEALLIGAIVGITAVVFGWVFLDLAKREIEDIARGKAKEIVDRHEEIYHNRNED